MKIKLILVLALLFVAAPLTHAQQVCAAPCVQYNVHSQFSAGLNVSTWSTTLNAVPNGEEIAVQGNWGKANATSPFCPSVAVTDNASGGSNIYVIDPPATSTAAVYWPNATYPYCFFQAHAWNVHGSPTTITMTFSPMASQEANISAMELKGALTTMDPLDTGCSQPGANSQQDSTTNNTGYSSSTPVTTCTNGDILVESMGFSAGAPGVGSGFTSCDNAIATMCQYELVGPAGTYDATYGANGAQQWVVLMSAYRRALWVTQNGAGADTGADLADAAPLSYLTNSANCGSGVNQVGPGRILELSGSFVFPANGTGGNWMNNSPCSGAAGNKIWLDIVPGFNANAPYFAWSPNNVPPTGGFMTFYNSNYIKVGGVDPCGTTTGGVDSTNTCDGVIENTSMGTAFPFTPGNWNQASGALMFENCTGCEVAGLEIANMYAISLPIPISSLTVTSGNGTASCTGPCTVGTGIVICFSGNSFLNSSANTLGFGAINPSQGGTLACPMNETYGTVVGTSCDNCEFGYLVTGNPGGNSITFTQAGTGRSDTGTGTGGTVFDETEGNAQIVNTAVNFQNVSGTSTSGSPDATHWDAWVHDSYIHDCGWCLLGFITSAGAQRIAFNRIFRFEHGWASGPSGFGTGPFSFDDNHLHNDGQWGNDPAVNFHVDPLHAQVDTNNNPQHYFTNFFVWGNTIDGNLAGATNYLFMRASSGNATTPGYVLFNNLFGCTLPNSQQNFIISLGDSQDWAGPSFTAYSLVYNNTITCSATFPNAGGGGISYARSITTGASATHGLWNTTEYNNIWQHGNSTAWYPGTTVGSYTAVDYNRYQASCSDNITDGHNCFGAEYPIQGPTSFISCVTTPLVSPQCDPAATGITPTLQTALGSACLSGNCGIHSAFYTRINMNLAANGMPNHGSPAIGAGINLCSTYSGAGWPMNQILFDNLGNARPCGSVAWDIGALYTGTAGPKGACTENLTATDALATAAQRKKAMSELLTLIDQVSGLKPIGNISETQTTTPSVTVTAQHFEQIIETLMASQQVIAAGGSGAICVSYSSH
jgi:hypothetical protein